MNCEATSELMDLCFNGGLSAEESRLFFGHIYSCERCSREYRMLGRMLDEIRHAPSPVSPANFWDDVWTQVHKGINRQVTPSMWINTHRLHLVVATVPLVSTLAILGFLLFGRESLPQMPLSEASSRHGMVVMSHPYGDAGLAMLAVSDGTVAEYMDND